VTETISWAACTTLRGLPRACFKPSWACRAIALKGARVKNWGGGGGWGGVSVVLSFAMVLFFSFRFLWLSSLPAVVPASRLACSRCGSCVLLALRFFSCSPAGSLPPRLGSASPVAAVPHLADVAASAAGKRLLTWPRLLPVPWQGRRAAQPSAFVSSRRREQAWPSGPGARRTSRAAAPAIFAFMAPGHFGERTSRRSRSASLEIRGWRQRLPSEHPSLIT